MVCRYINTRERKGKEGKDSVFRHSFRKHRSRARDSRQNRRKSRESNNALSFCLVDLRNCLETKHHGTSLSGLLAEFFSSRSRSHFVVPTFARIIVARTEIDPTSSSYLATLARRDIRTRELPRVFFQSKLKEDEGTSGHGHIRDTIFNFKETIATLFRRDTAEDNFDEVGKFRVYYERIIHAFEYFRALRSGGNSCLSRSPEVKFDGGGNA